MILEPIPGEPDRWFVVSESRPHITHIVDTDWVDDEGRRGCGCSCEQYMVRGAECKHIKAVKFYGKD